MHIGWPEGLMLGWIAIQLTVSATNDGQPLKPPYDCYRFGLTALRTAIIRGLLYWGGFFA
jgi:hypothetical protein